MREPTAETFLRDTTDHRMKVYMDNGLYRHVRFNSTISQFNMWFELVTWPSHLTIAGDMGTWTFSRVEDMFRFFRSSGDLEINPYYWSEKLQNGTHGGRDSARVFSEDAFAEQLFDQLQNHFGFEGKRLDELTAALKDEVLCYDNQHELLLAARDFKHEDFAFDPCELPSGKIYCYHFLWCLYAIVWGIQKWDESQRETQEAASQ